MEIERVDNGSEVTLRLKGCLDTAATPDFAAALRATAGARVVVLDMTGLEFISSSALRQLVLVRKERGTDFTLALTGMNEVVREVFDVTGLDEVFEIR